LGWFGLALVWLWFGLAWLGFKLNWEFLKVFDNCFNTWLGVGEALTSFWHSEHTHASAWH
jgi:hypothetical protein